MTSHLSWDGLAFRLLLTMLAGTVLGLNRGSRGHAAGLRTTILVTLAAAVAMMQADLLLSVQGKTSSSFAEMDVMRLPLGILTGVGFIGGGSILKRGNLVTGLTTAATLWIATVIGLCLGGGQLALGSLATVLALATLWAFKWLERHMPREQKATLAIGVAADEVATGELTGRVAAIAESFSCQTGFQRALRKDDGMEFWFEISWRDRQSSTVPADFIVLLGSHYQIRLFEMTTENH